MNFSNNVEPSLMFIQGRAGPLVIKLSASHSIQPFYFSSCSTHVFNASLFWLFILSVCRFEPQNVPHSSVVNTLRKTQNDGRMMLRKQVKVWLAFWAGSGMNTRGQAWAFFTAPDPIRSPLFPPPSVYTSSFVCRCLWAAFRWQTVQSRFFLVLFCLGWELSVNHLD